MMMASIPGVRTQAIPKQAKSGTGEEEEEDEE
jgi:hypothetical protein